MHHLKHALPRIDRIVVAVDLHLCFDRSGMTFYASIEHHSVPNRLQFQVINNMTTSNQNYVRLSYEKYYHDKVAYFKETFSKSGSGVVSTRVDESYVTKLLGYFKSR